MGGLCALRNQRFPTYKEGGVGSLFSLEKLTRVHEESFEVRISISGIVAEMDKPSPGLRW